MKLSILIAVITSGLLLSGTPVRADYEVPAGVSISATADFYAPLEPYGVWIDVGSYGRCWRPTHVAVGWRPYCDGYWVWTECGWYWASTEPWAWACYHYGRWVYERHYGWLWVPDTVWGPAWVSWRAGGGYVGWAPLPPHARFRAGVFVGVNVSPSLFVFCETAHFHRHHRPNTVVINQTTIINKTTNITKIKRADMNIEGVGSRNVVINEGPSRDSIAKATGNQVPTKSVREAVMKSPPPSSLQQKSPKTQDVTPTPPKVEPQPPPSREKITPSPPRPAPPSREKIGTPPAPSRPPAPPGREKKPSPSKPSRDGHEKESHDENKKQYRH